MINLFRVAFSNPSHGWLSVSLDNGEQQLSFSASFTPYDSITELVDALISVLTYGGTRTVRWNTEPCEYHFVFTMDGEMIELSVQECSDPTSKPPTVFSVCVQQAELAWPFWRALRKLESEQDIETQWGHPFPSHPLGRLREFIFRKKLMAGYQHGSF